MNNSTSARSTPLTRRWRIVSSRSVRERDEESCLCTDIRTARFLARARERALDGDTVRSDTPLVAVEWEDITAYSRTAIPEDFEPYRLRKLTCGMLWKDTTEYVVIVGDTTSPTRARTTATTISTSFLAASSASSLISRTPALWSPSSSSPPDPAARAHLAVSLSAPPGSGEGAPVSERSERAA